MSARIAIECDDVDVLNGVTLACDSVLAVPCAAVTIELATTGKREAIDVAGLPKLSSEMGIVTLRGRTPSPMATLILERLAKVPS